jgi:hypothetical protein
MCEIWSSQALNTKIIFLWVMTLCIYYVSTGVWERFFTTFSVEEESPDSSEMVLQRRRTQF